MKWVTSSSARLPPCGTSFEPAPIRDAVDRCYVGCMSDTIASTPLIVSAAPAEPPRLERPRTGVQYALIAYVLSLVAVFVVHFTARFYELETRATVQLLQRASVYASGLAFAATLVLWIRWQLRAARNARTMTRETPYFSPGWSVGCFFVPLVHLVAPLFALTEIWNASHGYRLGQRPPALLLAWWAGLLLPTLVLAASGILDGGAVMAALGLASVAAYPVSALLAAHAVGRINARQRAVAAGA
jgi:hypothetical protein